MLEIQPLKASRNPYKLLTDLINYTETVGVRWKHVENTTKYTFGNPSINGD